MEHALLAIQDMKLVKTHVNPLELTLTVRDSKDNHVQNAIKDTLLSMVTVSRLILSANNLILLMVNALLAGEDTI